MDPRKMVSRQTLIALLFGCAVSAFGQSSDDLSVEGTLKVLAGWPDIKEGICITKVAGFVWQRGHLLEEYRKDYVRINLSLDRDVSLPYSVEYFFKGGKLTHFELKKRDNPPDFDSARKKWFESEPWVLIDRSLYGYNFKVSPAWRLLHEEDIQSDGCRYKLTILGMPETYDDNLGQWIENSVQWCVFQRENPYETIDEVRECEEGRLEKMGSIITKRDRVRDGNGASYVYESEYRGKPYIGKTYYYVSHGRGYAIRFNATQVTYRKNLPRFEEFVAHFKISDNRAMNPDMELIKTKAEVLSIVGDSCSAEELEGMPRAIIRPLKLEEEKTESIGKPPK